LGLFMALGVEWLSLRHAGKATTSVQVRERLGIFRNAQRAGMPSMLVVLISGFYMMATARIGSAWIVVAFGALILLVLLGLMFTGPRMGAIRKALTMENGPVSLSLRSLLHDSRLWLTLHVRASIVLGIVFLMTVKPDLPGSLISMGVAIILGMALSLSMKSRGPEKIQA